jgi:hypothetical protein
MSAGCRPQCKPEREVHAPDCLTVSTEIHKRCGQRHSLGVICPAAPQEHDPRCEFKGERHLVCRWAGPMSGIWLVSRPGIWVNPNCKFCAECSEGYDNAHEGCVCRCDKKLCPICHSADPAVHSAGCSHNAEEYLKTHPGAVDRDLLFLNLTGAMALTPETPISNEVPVPQPHEMVVGATHYGGADNPYEHRKVMVAIGLHHDAFLYICTKYFWRLGKKPGANVLEDLKKAREYLNFRIEEEEKKTS